MKIKLFSYLSQRHNKNTTLNLVSGFTLIELLVVIAIIGILASVVLAALSSARMKARVATTQSTLASMRSQAELGMNNGKYIADICTVSTPGGLKLLLDSIDQNVNRASKVTNLRCGQNSDTGITSNGWGVEATIDGKYFCSDSTGFAGQITIEDIIDDLTSPTANVKCLN